MHAPENNVQYVERYSVTKEEENGDKHIIYTTEIQLTFSFLLLNITVYNLIAKIFTFSMF